MTEALVVPLIIVVGVCLLAASCTWLQRQYAGAHLINLVPLALICASALFAMGNHTAGEVKPGGLLLLAAALAVVALDAGAAARSARWAVLFWLTWLANVWLIGGLIYLKFFFKIF
ncbi:MAG: hypothetical protein ABI178_13080 [Rhodanobacter sp.]